MTRRIRNWILLAAMVPGLSGCATLGGRPGAAADARLPAKTDVTQTGDAQKPNVTSGTIEFDARAHQLVYADAKPPALPSPSPPETPEVQPASLPPPDKAPQPSPAAAPAAQELPTALPETHEQPTQAASSPVQPARLEPLVEALQCIIDNQPHKALQLLAKYDQNTQEVFLRLLPILARMTQQAFDQLTPAEVAFLHEQMQSLIGTLRPLSKLTIDKACFCEWIKSFGVYKPLPEGHAFLGSTPTRPGELVQLYVELRNFACEASNGTFATRLSSSVEIRDQKGDQVWLYQFEDGKQPIRSRTMLHDYFNNYCFYVPNNLPPGTYTLVIQVRDETRPSQPRVASKAMEFRVTSMVRGQ